MSQLTQGNPLVHSDYTAGYRDSRIAAERPLELPDPAERDRAFEQIRSELAVPLDTLHDIYTSIVDGKHVLLYGPPGTGKTTLAGMLAEHLFNCDAHRETAVADWTPFETIGGLQLETTRDGKERLAPQPGVITRQVVTCLNRIGARELNGNGKQGAWLVIDELNRANMDAAFGQFFTALDAAHPVVSLPFFDPPRQTLWVPRRFRIIGTMNTFDRNFLYRLSYALTRRFALISIDVPPNNDSDAREEERDKLWQNLASTLADRGVRTSVPTSEDLQREYEADLMQPLYDVLVTRIRAPQPDGLGRGLGFAQVAAALRHAVFAVELGLVSRDRIVYALDRGIRSSIVPQLEGLPTESLEQFADWWEQQPTLRDTRHSIAAMRELLRGASLFRME